jgi:flagellar protein FlaF
MTYSAQNGYSQIRRETASPRQVEYQVLTQIAAELETADPKSPAGYRMLAAAVQRNTELWSTLAADLMDTSNACDASLKVNLLNIANFAIQHGAAVLRGEADQGPLADINRTVAAGLKPVGQKAA